MNTSDMVNKLIAVIGREAELFESFLELLEHQQEMLVKNDLKGLTEVTSQQQEKLIISQNLNQHRLELVEAIKRDHNLDGDVNVSRLIDIVDREQADRLAMLQNIILNLTDKINDTRNQNAILLNRSREYIVKTVEMLSRIGSPKTGYTSKGVNADTRNNLALDRRV